MPQPEQGSVPISGALLPLCRVVVARPWSTHQVKPAFFPVPASVVFGKRTKGEAVALEETAERWFGRLPSTNVSWQVAESSIERTSSPSAAASDEYASPYRSRFAQGATVVPRMLFLVEEARAGPLGTGAGRASVHSARSNQEKHPWRDVESLTGTVEAQFVRPLLLGASIVNYLARAPALAVIPLEGERLLDSESEALDMYPGLAARWRRAEAVWMEHRSSERLPLREQLDFRKKLSDQLPAQRERVVYAASGMYLSACRVDDPRIVIDHQLYWATVSGPEEGRFLSTILNSPVVTEMVRPLQARGEHNPRDFDKYVWQLPIPEFNPRDEHHARLAGLGAEAEAFVAGLTLPDSRFETMRRFVREQLSESDVGRAIDAEVRDLLSE